MNVHRIGHAALGLRWASVARVRCRCRRVRRDGRQPRGVHQRRTTLEQAITVKAVDLLSGPGGLASFLRTRQLGARLAGPSLPLDIGYRKTIPPGIRNAVILRDRRCRWPGGYFL
jgi:hypothetical protein